MNCQPSTHILAATWKVPQLPLFLTTGGDLQDALAIPTLQEFRQPCVRLQGATGVASS